MLPWRILPVEQHSMKQSLNVQSFPTQIANKRNVISNHSQRNHKNKPIVSSKCQHCAHLQLITASTSREMNKEWVSVWAVLLSTLNVWVPGVTVCCGFVYANRCFAICVLCVLCYKRKILLSIVIIVVVVVVVVGIYVAIRKYHNTTWPLLTFVSFSSDFKRFPLFVCCSIDDNWHKLCFCLVSYGSVRKCLSVCEWLSTV